MINTELVWIIIIFLIVIGAIYICKKYCEQKRKKYFYMIFLLLSGVPLFLYPVVMLANLMSMIGHQITLTTTAEHIEALLFQILLVTTTIYPIIYIVCFVKARKAYKQGNDATILSAFPLLVILFICAIIGNF